MIEPYTPGQAVVCNRLKRPRGRPWSVAASNDTIHVAFVQKDLRVLEVEVAAPPKEDLLVALGIGKRQPLLLHEKERKQPRRR